MIERFLSFMSVILFSIVCGFSFAAAQDIPDGAHLKRRIQVSRPVPVVPIAGKQPKLEVATNLIRAGIARASYHVSGKGLTVAVLDTGIFKDHNDFAGRILAEMNFTRDNGGSSQDANDGNGHGTNVTGIVAAGGTHTGIAPGAGIVALKVLTDDGGGNFSDVAKALDWVIKNAPTYNISVVNMSLGDSTNDQDASNHGFGDDKAIADKIHTLRTMDIAVVVAAGNDYFENNSFQGMSFPAIISESVSVGAVYSGKLNLKGYKYGGGAQAVVSQADQICVFSQRLHSTVSDTFRTDIFAPGAPIDSTGIDGDGSTSTDQGTSQATPMIAGSILLFQELYLKANGVMPSVDLIEASLRSTAVTLNDVQPDPAVDNVDHTNLDFPRVDVLAMLQSLVPLTDLDMDGIPDFFDSDIDGDGYSNSIETLLGSSPTDAASVPWGGSPIIAQPLPLVSKASIKLQFAKTGQDVITVQSTLPVPANFTLSGQTLIVDVGGIITTVTLNAKGQSPKSSTTAIALKPKIIKSVAQAGSAPLAIKLAKGSFVTTLTHSGLGNRSMDSDVPILVHFVFNSQVFEGTVNGHYKATKDKSGTFSF